MHIKPNTSLNMIGPKCNYHKHSGQSGLKQKARHSSSSLTPVNWVRVPPYAVLKTC